MGNQLRGAPHSVKKMKEKKLKAEDLGLLREVLWRRKPGLLVHLERLGKVRLTTEQREEIRLVLADELSEVGLEESGEPNERGLTLDSLIGDLMHY